MEEIYTIRPEVKPSFFNKIFKRLPKKNLVIEINNLLATNPLQTISAFQVSAIISKYRIKSIFQVKNEMYSLYMIYLNYCFLNRIIDEEKTKNLKYLSNILSISPPEANKFFNDIASEIYKKLYKEIIDSNINPDGSITPEDKARLEQLKNDLTLANDIATKSENDINQIYVNCFINKALTDKRLPPYFNDEINLICSNLNIKLNIDAITSATIEKYKLYWLVEHGQTPEIGVDIALPQNEKCYFATRSDLLEMRTVTQRVNYSGITSRVQITKGIYYRAGSIKPTRITAEKLMVIDTGKLYLTNKRLIFMGNKKNTNIKLDKILSIVPYSDGVEVCKDTGKNQIYKFNLDSELFTMILSHLINV